MADVSKLSDEQVDKVFEDCLNLENTFYTKGWDAGVAKVNDEATQAGKQYGYSFYAYYSTCIENYMDLPYRVLFIIASLCWVL